MSYTGTCYAVDPKKSIRVVPYCRPTEPHSQRRLGTSLARWHVCDLLGQRINKWRLRATVLSWTVSPDVERKPVNRCVKCCTNRFHKSLIVSQQPKQYQKPLHHWLRSDYPRSPCAMEFLEPHEDSFSAYKRQTLPGLLCEYYNLLVQKINFKQIIIK